MSTAVSHTCIEIMSKWEHGQCDTCAADVKGTCISKAFQSRGKERGPIQHFCSVDCCKKAEEKVENLFVTHNFFCLEHGHPSTLIVQCSDKKGLPLDRLTFFSNRRAYSKIKTAFNKEFPNTDFSMSCR